MYEKGGKIYESSPNERDVLDRAHGAGPEAGEQREGLPNICRRYRIDRFWVGIDSGY